METIGRFTCMLLAGVLIGSVQGIARRFIGVEWMLSIYEFVVFFVVVSALLRLIFGDKTPATRAPQIGEKGR